MRSKRGTALDSRTSRLKLEARTDPYWVVLEKGRSLGYRKGKRGGEWVARYHDPLAKPRMRYHGLGSADDLADADGAGVLDYAQAQEAARAWFKVARAEALGERTPGIITVARAVEEYLDDRKRAGAKTAGRMRWDFDAHVIPTLGDTAVERMTPKRVQDWMDAVASAGRRVRGVEQEAGELRRSSANRMWTNLRAALNLAAKNHKIPPTWKGAKGYPGADQARVRWLNAEEQARLIEAIQEDDFRRLIQGAIATGAREGELFRLVVRDFDPVKGQLWIAPGKTGNGRWIVLESKDAEMFKAWTEGREPGDPIFPRTTYKRRYKRSDGAWKKASVLRDLETYCEKAKIERLTFHEFRHTYASALVNRGVPLVFVAAQLGHKDTKMVEKHYGHLCDEARTRAIRG